MALTRAAPPTDRRIAATLIDTALMLFVGSLLAIIIAIPVNGQVIGCGSHCVTPPAQVSAKLLAYERYRQRDGPARDGLGQMPPVLLIAALEAGETRLAGLAAALWPDPTLAMPLLLTTEPLLLADTAGWLGRVWRPAWSGARRYWPWEVEQTVRRERRT